jgi:hypothetical protein
MHPRVLLPRQPIAYDYWAYDYWNAQQSVGIL